MEYIKTKTSKWTLIFDNDQRIELDKIRDENLIFNPNGAINIIIQSFSIDDELINLTKSARNITELIQTEGYVELTDVSEESTREILHRFVTIKSITIKEIDRCDHVLEIILSNE